MEQLRLEAEGEYARRIGSVAESPEQEHAKVSALSNFLELAERALRPREAQVLRLRFGIDDGDAKGLEHVAQVMNVTRERIRQIEHKALRKIRRAAVKNPQQFEDVVDPAVLDQFRDHDEMPT